MTERKSIRRIWRVPAAVGLVSAGGLLFALLGDGWADALSWIALSIPVSVAAWVLRPRGSRTAPRS